MYFSIEKELLAPTLLSVRKKTSSDFISTEETTIGEDDEEDPMVTHLEQDETEIETETQRKKTMNIYSKEFYFHQLETPPTSTEIVEMGQTNQNVLRLLEEDEKVR
jgi:hypothetical protein